MTNNKQSKSFVLLLPIVGIILFIILYYVATLYYPGGSQFDKNSPGFSWSQNQWCNLFNEDAINGKPNPGRPVAISAMIILCSSLMFFWYVFVRQTAAGSAQGNIIITSGFVSMITGMFLFAGPHDILLNIASFAGLVAVITILIVLHKHKYYGLFWMGICNLFLVILNNILYYGEGLQIYLPVVQKFTFLFFLVWIAFLNIKVVNGLKHTLPGFSSQD